MLSRRYLRIKVFQSLYAYWQSDNASPARIEKELSLSVERTFDMFLSLLLTFGELRHVAELLQEERLKKHLPTENDLKPNQRFMNNPLLKAIAESDRLRMECEKNRISWVGQMDIFLKLYKEIEASEDFQAYLIDREPNYEKDQAFLIRLFSERIANSEALQEEYEARSIYWMEDLDLAATLVKRSLEQMRETDIGDPSLGELLRDPKEETEFVTMLFRKTVEFGDEHEKAIADKASNWEADRIAVSDMILMKMALTEVRVFDQIPVKVTLNEYIEIAKAYSTPKSKNFINGVLDKLFIEMKSDGRIQKVGRGLLES